MASDQFAGPMTAPAPLTGAGTALTLSTDDPDATASAYERLLGGPVDDVVSVRNGSVSWRQSSEPHRVAFGHTMFGAEGLADVQRLLARRSLLPTEPVDAIDTVRLDERVDHDIVALDHLVFTAPGRDRALALFGATLGFDFRLDRELGGGARQLFFRAGTGASAVVLEVVTGLDPESAGDDLPACALWGVAWRSADLDATYRRLSESSTPVSEIRDGAKTGTRIFTVRDRALATRTVVIA